MQLGPFSKETPVFLAPMAGVTDLPMRQLAVRHGADVAVGEMMASDLSLSDSRKSMLRAQHSKEAGLRAIQLVGMGVFSDGTTCTIWISWNTDHAP